MLTILRQPMSQDVWLLAGYDGLFLRSSYSFPPQRQMAPER